MSKHRDRGRHIRLGGHDQRDQSRRQLPDYRQSPRFNVQTDDAGAIYGNEYNAYGIDCPRLTTAMYVCGIFRTEEIVGDLAAAVSTGLFGRVLQGGYDGPGLYALT